MAPGIAPAGLAGSTMSHMFSLAQAAARGAATAARTTAQRLTADETTGPQRTGWMTLSRWALPSSVPSLRRSVAAAATFTTVTAPAHAASTKATADAPSIGETLLNLAVAHPDMATATPWVAAGLSVTGMVASDILRYRQNQARLAGLIPRRSDANPNTGYYGTLLGTAVAVGAGVITTRDTPSELVHDLPLFLLTIAGAFVTKAAVTAASQHLLNDTITRQERGMWLDSHAKKYLAKVKDATDATEHSQSIALEALLSLAEDLANPESDYNKHREALSVGISHNIVSAFAALIVLSGGIASITDPDQQAKVLGGLAKLNLSYDLFHEQKALLLLVPVAELADTTIPNASGLFEIIHQLEEKYPNLRPLWQAASREASSLGRARQKAAAIRQWKADLDQHMNPNTTRDDSWELTLLGMLNRFPGTDDELRAAIAAKAYQLGQEGTQV